MRYIQIEKPGGPEVLQLVEGPIPEPGPGEVLIRVEACGVNRPDILQRKGLYPPPPGASPILGLEVAGTVERVSGTMEWKPGDRVCALVAGGGYAEYCVAPAPQCLPIPRGLTAEQAAGIPETFFTVWANVFERGRLVPGETLLVHGGASGIGTTAIQLGRAFGARVLVTAGTDEKCQACLALGASAPINYREQDFVAEGLKLTEGRGVDVILDMVGGDYFGRNLELLADNGRIVQIGTQRGQEVTLPFRTLMAKGATVTGSTLRPRSVDQKGFLAKKLRERVWPLLEAGRVRVVVDRSFPLALAADAHRRMESDEHVGKLILIV